MRHFEKVNETFQKLFCFWVLKGGWHRDGPATEAEPTNRLIGALRKPTFT